MRKLILFLISYLVSLTVFAAELIVLEPTHDANRFAPTALATQSAPTPQKLTIRLKDLETIPGSVDVELEPISVFTNDSVVIEHSAMGSQTKPLTSSKNYYFGRIDGKPEQTVFLSATPEGVKTLIIRDHDKTSIAEATPTHSANRYALHVQPLDSASGKRFPPFQCGVDADFIEMQKIKDPEFESRRLHFNQTASRLATQNKQKNPPLSAATSTVRVATVIVETDYELYQTLNARGKTVTDYVTDLFAFISSIYRSEAGATFKISRLYIYTSNIDPWTATDTHSMLDELQAYWNDPVRFGIPRHHVHLLSGKKAGGGVAFPNTLGVKEYAYGVSANMTGSFTVEPAAWVWDAIVVAHEIGHAFGSGHTHNFDDPYVGSNQGGAIDCCFSDYANSQCGYFLGGAGKRGFLPGPNSLTGGTPGEGNGTIMSYCHLLEGYLSNIAPTFGITDYGVNPGRVVDILSVAAQTYLPEETTETATLTVTKAGTSSGTVTSNPAGISCGTDCSEAFAKGSTVTLTATPSANATFTAWSGACTHTETACTITLTADDTATAIFAPAFSGSESARESVQKAYIAYYGRPADPGGLSYWAEQLDNAGGNLNAIIQAFGTSDEFTRRYGNLSNEELITGIYQQLFNRAPDPGGLAYYLDELTSGRKTLQTIALDVLYGAQGNDATRIANKLTAAQYYTALVNAGCPYISEEEGVSYLANVLLDNATVTNAMEELRLRCGF